MSDSIRNYHVVSRSSSVDGRAICSARQHHFIVDDVGYEEVNAGEFFLAGVTACAVNTLGRVIKEMEFSCQELIVSAEATYDRNKQTNNVTLFQTIKICFEFSGIKEALAQELVNIYKERCPLYGTVVTATPDVSVEVITR